jgi:hypothetical protein
LRSPRIEAFVQKPAVSGSDGLTGTSQGVIYHLYGW